MRALTTLAASLLALLTLLAPYVAAAERPSTSHCGPPPGAVEHIVWPTDPAVLLSLRTPAVLTGDTLGGLRKKCVPCASPRTTGTLTVIEGAC